MPCRACALSSENHWFVYALEGMPLVVETPFSCLARSMPYRRKIIDSCFLTYSIRCTFHVFFLPIHSRFLGGIVELLLFAGDYSNQDQICFVRKQHWNILGFCVCDLVLIAIGAPRQSAEVSGEK